jgi:hypothetical protein
MNTDIKQMTTEMLEKHLIQVNSALTTLKYFLKTLQETYDFTVKLYSQQIESIEQELKNRGQ